MPAIPVGVLNFIGTWPAQFKVRIKDPLGFPPGTLGLFNGARVTAFGDANYTIAYDQKTQGGLTPITLKVEVGLVYLVVEPVTDPRYSTIELVARATDPLAGQRSGVIGFNHQDKLLPTTITLFPPEVTLSPTPGVVPKIGFRLLDGLGTAIVGVPVQLKSLDGLLFQTLSTDGNGQVQLDVPANNWNGEDDLVIDAGAYGAVSTQPPADGSVLSLQNDGV